MGDAFMDNPAKVTALLSAPSKGDRDAATRLILLIDARAAAAGGQLRPRAKREEYRGNGKASKG